MGVLSSTVEISGGGGGLQVDPRQAEGDAHQHRPGSNLGSLTGSIESPLGRKAPVKVWPPPNCNKIESTHC